MPIKEVALGVTMERVVGTFKLTAPAVGTVATLPLEIAEITALVVAVTAASKEMPSA